MHDCFLIQYFREHIRGNSLLDIVLDDPDCIQGIDAAESQGRQSWSQNDNIQVDLGHAKHQQIVPIL